jgi:uncharacterized integral membrane protein
MVATGWAKGPGASYNPSFEFLLGACVMRYLVWVLRLLVFIAVLIFAVKNTDPVKVNFYADYAVQNVPLIVVMLVTFVVGAVFGLLLTVPVSMRRRREVARLRREVERLQAAAANAGAELNSAQLSPESIAPMSPL